MIGFAQSSIRYQSPFSSHAAMLQAMSLPDERLPGRGGSSRQRALEELMQRFCTGGAPPPTADEAQVCVHDVTGWRACCVGWSWISPTVMRYVQLLCSIRRCIDAFAPAITEQLHRTCYAGGRHTFGCYGGDEGVHAGGACAP